MEFWGICFYYKWLFYRGKTKNKRTVNVKAETSGRVVERLVERGSAVKADQAICKIAVEDRAVAIDEAMQALNKQR